MRSSWTTQFSQGSHVSVWAMMLAGFAGLGVFGWRGSRKIATPAT
jgi:hypothetical protein